MAEELQLGSAPKARTASPQTARFQIAARTRQAHEALHHHPVIGRLLADDLSISEYRHILSVFRDVFVAAESCRSVLGVFPEFSLQRQCEALLQDAPPAAHNTACSLVCFGTDHEVLGMLYTLHGAQFGGAVIHRHLRQTLPFAPMAYYDLKTDPKNWKSLVVELERSCKQKGAIDCISAGAQQTFELIDVLASTATAADIPEHEAAPAVGRASRNLEP